MTVRIALAMLLGMGGAAGCGSKPCELPAGCVRVSDVRSCTCAEWETVSIVSVPIKYVVVSVLYRPPGNASEAVYGFHDGPGMPPASSDLGSRFRAVVRSSDGTETVATLASIPTVPGSRMLRVTDASMAVRLAGGDGQGSGSAWGWGTSTDVPLAHAKDSIIVWVNPTLTIETDAAGGKKANWGWTAVGGCYGYSCEGPSFLSMSVEEIDGTIPAWSSHAAQFLATLTPEERADIVRYDPFYDPPGRDPATLDADPRFLRLPGASFGPGYASYPSGSWTPCTGTLSDADFVPLAEREAPFGWWSSQKLAVQHGVETHQATCVAQQPGLVMGTTTPGCDMTTLVYVDRAFGTFLFAPVSAGASCTVP